MEAGLSFGVQGSHSILNPEPLAWGRPGLQGSCKRRKYQGSEKDGAAVYGGRAGIVSGLDRVQRLGLLTGSLKTLQQVNLQP